MCAKQKIHYIVRALHRHWILWFIMIHLSNRLLGTLLLLVPNYFLPASAQGNIFNFLSLNLSKPPFLCATDLTLSLGCTDAWNILVGATSVSGFDLSRIIVQQTPHSTSHLITDSVMKSHHEPDWENTPGDGSHTYLALEVNLLLGVDWPRGS